MRGGYKCLAARYRRDRPSRAPEPTWTSFASSAPSSCRAGVFLQVGLGLHFWLNILLTLLGYIPGIIHAIWVVLRK